MDHDLFPSARPDGASDVLAGQIPDKRLATPDLKVVQGTLIAVHALPVEARETRPDLLPHVLLDLNPGQESMIVGHREWVELDRPQDR